MIEIEKISGIGEFVEREHGEEGEDRVFEVGLGVKGSGVSLGEGSDRVSDGGSNVGRGKAFLVIRSKTIEVRCDGKLGKVLREKYETVMESRYFGRGGVEIVPSGQLEDAELEDLVRLSYNMTKKMTEEE